MVSIKELRNSTRQERKDYLYAFIDYLAYYPAWILIRTPMTPNQITILWIIGQTLSALLLLNGDRVSMLIGIFSFQLFFILDCTDGIVARYKNKYSLNGVYFDYLGHYLTNPLLLVCYGVANYKLYGEIGYLYLGLGTALLFLLNKATTINPFWYSDKKHRESVEICFTKALIKNQRNLIYILFAFFRLEYIFNLMFLGTLVGYPNLTLLIYSLFFFLELIRKVSSQISINYATDKKETSP